MRSHQNLSPAQFVALCLGPGPQYQYLHGILTSAQNDQRFWRKAVDLVGRHRLTPALWVAIRDKDLTRILDDELSQYLQSIYELNRLRNQLILKQIGKLTKALNASGIEPILLKGAAGLATNLYADPGQRVMTDIDILVAPEQFDTALQQLRQSGWSDYHQVAPKLYRGSQHAPPLWLDDGAGATVEVHHRLMRRKGLLSTQECLRMVEPITVDDANAYVLSANARMLHHLLHATVGGGWLGKFRTDLHQLYETTLLCGAFQNRVDWAFIETSIRQFGLSTPVQVHFAVAKTLFESPLTTAFSASALQRMRAFFHYKAAEYPQCEWLWSYIRLLKPPFYYR
ncbi:MAG: nucleotidyltransferase family protein [Gammaproteobacteria bacterium]